MQLKEGSGSEGFTLVQSGHKQTLNVNSHDGQFKHRSPPAWYLSAGLGSKAAMSLLGREEGSRLVELVLAPEGVDNPDPHIAERTYRHAMRFALLALTLVVGLGPGFLKRPQPEQTERAHCAKV